MTGTLVDLAGPKDEEAVVLRWTGAVAKEFFEMLNMNKVRNSRGERLEFALRDGPDWTVYVTTYTDEPVNESPLG